MTKRYPPKPDLAHVLDVDLLEEERFDKLRPATNSLTSTVSKCVFDDVRQYALKLRPSYDDHPTVCSVNPMTDQERDVSESYYFKRFTSN